MFQFCHARAHDPNTGKNTGENTGENTGKNTGKILEKIQEKYKKNTGLTGEKLKSETFSSYVMVRRDQIFGGPN